MAQLLCDVAHLHASSGAASTTKGNASAWLRWELFRMVTCFNPECPDVRWAGPVKLAREITLFCQFLVWTYASMLPKTHAHMLARPLSANAVLVPVRRVLALCGIATPPAAETKRVLHGLEKAFVAKLGPAALLPTRKGPLTADMLVSILLLKSFQVNGSAFCWSDRDDAAIRSLFLVMRRTGMRKDYAIRLRADSVSLRPHSGCNVRQGTTKADQLGQVWGSGLMWLPPPSGWPLDASSALRALPARSGGAPLLAGSDGKLLKHAYVDNVFCVAVHAALAADVASNLSCTASACVTCLFEAGCSNGAIARFCRWSSEEMVCISARVRSWTLSHMQKALEWDGPDRVCRRPPAALQGSHWLPLAHAAAAPPVVRARSAPPVSRHAPEPVGTAGHTSGQAVRPRAANAPSVPVKVQWAARLRLSRLH
jgi:hypothetical protein